MFYHQLHKAVWYWNEEAIDHVAGYGESSVSGEQLDLENILNKEDDISGKIRKQVNAFYKPFFITLQDSNNLAAGEDNGLLWGMINEVFTSKAAQALLQLQPLRWICIDFPQTAATILLEFYCETEELDVLMNAMPRQ